MGEEGAGKGALRGGGGGQGATGAGLEGLPKPVQLHSAADIRGLEIPLDLQFKAAASLRMERFISALQMQAGRGSSVAVKYKSAAAPKSPEKRGNGV